MAFRLLIKLHHATCDAMQLKFMSITLAKTLRTVSTTLEYLIWYYLIGNPPQ